MNSNNTQEIRIQEATVWYVFLHLRCDINIIIKDSIPYIYLFNIKEQLSFDLNNIYNKLQEIRKLNIDSKDINEWFAIVISIQNPISILILFFEAEQKNNKE